MSHQRGTSGAEPFRVPATVGREGRLTLPAAVREALGLEEGSQLLLEVDPTNDQIVVRPSLNVPRSHAWAYTDDHLRRFVKAQGEIHDGEVAELSPEEVSAVLEKAVARTTATGSEVTELSASE